MRQEPAQNPLVGAAADVINMLQARLATDGKVHVGTLLAAAARLAGTSLFRSFGYAERELTPGVVVLSEKANEEWPKLAGAMFAGLKAIGIVIDEKKLVMKPPSSEAPRLSTEQMQLRFQDEYALIMEQRGLSMVDAARSGAIACAMIIKGAPREMDLQVLGGIAVMGFVEGAKTAPPPLSTRRDA